MVDDLGNDPTYADFQSVANPSQLLVQISVLSVTHALAWVYLTFYTNVERAEKSVAIVTGFSTIVVTAFMIFSFVKWSML